MASEFPIKLGLEKKKTTLRLVFEKLKRNSIKTNTIFVQKEPETPDFRSLKNYEHENSKDIQNVDLRLSKKHSHHENVNLEFSKIIKEVFLVNQEINLKLKSEINVEKEPEKREAKARKSANPFGDSMDESGLFFFVKKMHNVLRNLKKRTYKSPFQELKIRSSQILIFSELEIKINKSNKSSKQLFFVQIKHFVNLNNKKQATENELIENSFDANIFDKKETKTESESFENFSERPQSKNISQKNDYRNLKSITISSRDQFFKSDIKIESVKKIFDFPEGQQNHCMSNSNFDDLKHLAKNIRNASQKSRKKMKKIQQDILQAAKLIFRGLKENVRRIYTGAFFKLRTLKKKITVPRNSKILYAKITEIKSLAKEVFNPYLGQARRSNMSVVKKGQSYLEANRGYRNLIGTNFENFVNS